MLNSHAREELILITDPKVLSIPVYENHEPMIDLTIQRDISYGPPPLLPNNTNYTKVRNTIFDKLKQAQLMLPNELKFCLYEGYRSLELQEKIFQERYTRLQKENPQFTHEQLFIESTKFVSPITNLDGTKNIPPHATGAAIDVYLVDNEGKVVDMGIHLDDTYNDLTGIYCKTDSQLISAQAQEHRKFMSKALQSVGFVNYPTEYWHWSYGDRYWAYHKQEKFALYDTINI